jgi:hypothetical protein
MRSFDLVDFKIMEADFFLKKLSQEATTPITCRFYFSAFTAAARSVTFCLQSVLSDLEGFKMWYEKRQIELSLNPVTKFFVEARNMAQKVGVVPIDRWVSKGIIDGKLQMEFYFASDHPDFGYLPNGEVGVTCVEYLKCLLNLVYDCYVDFGVEIDPHQHYTKANFLRIGKTIDDADEELMGVRGWTFIEGWPEAYRWQAHRDQLPGCRIAHLFYEYLKIEVPKPPRLPNDQNDFNGNDWVPPSIEFLSS